MIFLGWLDDTPHKTVADKIRDGAAACAARFHMTANVCLCSPQNAAAVGGHFEGMHVGTAVDDGPPLVTTPNLFLLGRIERAESLASGYQQARGAIPYDGTPSEVIIRRGRDEEE